MDKMQQDSRKAYEVTVKIHILTLQWPSQFGYPICPEGGGGGAIPLFESFFFNLSLR